MSIEYKQLPVGNLFLWIKDKMEIKELLQKEIKEVRNAFLDKEFNMNFLRVEVSTKDLKSIEEISKRISALLDEKDPIDGEYFLDVFSPGTDQEFDPKDSKDHINEHVKVELFKNIKDMDEFIGDLIDADDENMTIKWNAKGQFKKTQISIDNIKIIKKYSKIKK